ncbi:MAG: xanthine dehydrogenase family protein subunit M [Bradyrhizobium sp.]|nr:xanthine dehydrogenase family protein subunit M [Bradyrhizobium sp.]
MKAAAFAYARAKSVDDAVQLLAAHGDRAKVLSGGQSLMPAMNLRLISPELIVDIGGISELRSIVVQGDVLRIGALTRHVDLQRSPEIAAYAPLLAEAIAHVAHPAIRNRGTLGGSLAHADPAAELPACMLALEAIIVVRGTGGEQRIAAVDFFQGIFQTALSAEELLVAIEFPIAQKNCVHYFHEFARRHGDYAIAGLAACADIEAGILSRLRTVFFAVGDRPLLAKAADRLLNVAVTPKLLSEVSSTVGDELDPQGDQQASGAMRRHLARVLLTRCVTTMLNRPELTGGTA